MYSDMSLMSGFSHWALKSEPNPPSIDQWALPSHPTHCQLPHLLGSKGSWRKGTRPRSDRVIRMERSSFKLSLLYTPGYLTPTHMCRHVHKNGKHIFKSGLFLTVTYCHPNTVKALHSHKNTDLCLAEHEPETRSDSRQRMTERNAESKRRRRNMVIYSITIES